jgi:hypothetical protein
MFRLKYAAFGRRVLQMENAETVQIRLLEESDPPNIAATFKNMGWNKPETQYWRYFARAGGRDSNVLRRQL